MNRRHFLKTNLAVTAGFTLSRADFFPVQAGYPIRLGAPVSGDFKDPADWVKAHKNMGYSAAYCPVQPGAEEALIKAYRDEARENNILIAEAGVWNNLMDPDEAKRKQNLQKNIDCLRLADQIGAHCCVNISGARGVIWDGPYPGNYAADTFNLIVETVRKIIDEAKPVSSFYTLEPMPYMLPDSPDSYMSLIKAVGRKQFAAHLDPVNMISSPQRYYGSTDFLKECFKTLGPYIKSIHAKDILIMPELTVHLEERRPGLGQLDYITFLQEASKLKGVPFMLEHLKKQEDYRLAAEYLRQTGRKAGVTFA